MPRKNTNTVSVGSLTIGGSAPIAVQSMTNTDTRNVQATVNQINQLVEAGCDLVRIAVINEEAGMALGEIVKSVNVPLVADIHFDYRLALLAIEQGINKLRINPGNIGSKSKVEAVVKAAKDHGVPIRIGVNIGSLAKWTLEKYGRTARAMVESGLEHVRILEDHGFYDTVISMKSSNVATTLEAYRLVSKKVNYPLHLGITEAGTTWFGTIKSVAGIAPLLEEGIGDTLRVSLTGNPVEEVKVGWALLKALDLRQRGPVFISCPTCGRTQIDLESIATEVEQRLVNLTKPLTIAIMGCVVNGPGEAQDADIGIAGGNGVGLLFRKGEVIRKVAEDELVDALVDEAYRFEFEDD